MTRTVVLLGGTVLHPTMISPGRTVPLGMHVRTSRQAGAPISTDFSAGCYSNTRKMLLLGKMGPYGSRVPTDIRHSFEVDDPTHVAKR